MANSAPKPDFSRPLPLGRRYQHWLITLLLTAAGTSVQASDLHLNLTLADSGQALIARLLNSDERNHRVTLPRQAQADPGATSDCLSLPLAVGSQLLLSKGSCRQFLLPLEAKDNWQRSITIAPEREFWQLPTSLWLVRAEAPLQLTLDLPTAYSVSAPWEITHKEGVHEFTVPPSELNDRGLLLLGKFSNNDLTLGGVKVDLAYLGAAEDYDKIYFWLERNLSQLWQTVEAPLQDHLQIVITPATSRPGKSPVPFGHVLRAGHHSIQFFTDTNAKLEQLLADWTAAHEFSHLLLPYLDTNGKWVSEGFASYYQNLLMAHMGEYSPTQAWSKLLAGFGRAQRERPAVSPSESVQRGMSKSRMMIYWSGAAMALMADVEIRTRSNGKQSLSTVLGQFSSCCLPSDRTWTVSELFQQLDRFSPGPVFIPLYNRYADRPGLPPVGETLKQLGVSHSNYRKVEFKAAPLADIREAIMAVAIDPKYHPHIP